MMEAILTLAFMACLLLAVGTGAFTDDNTDE